MSEHRTPDELSPQQQTELICKKLLGLQVLHLPYLGAHACTTWCDDKYKRYDHIAKFENWSEAGLILEALQAKLGGSNFNTAAWDQLRKMGHLLSIGKLAPTDVRAAAVAFILAWHGEQS
jgi:hypothetical protein